MTDPRHKLGNRRDPYWQFALALALFAFVIVVALWGAYHLGYDDARDRFCTHGESSVVFDSRTGVTSGPTRTGCP